MQAATCVATSPLRTFSPQCCRERGYVCAETPKDMIIIPVLSIFGIRGLIRIDLGGAACRQPAREPCDRDQDHRHSDERRRVSRFNFKEQPRENSRERKGAEQAKDGSHQYELHPVTDDKSEHITTLCAQGHP